jgi:hypothetical protein
MKIRIPLIVSLLSWLSLFASIWLTLMGVIEKNLPAMILFLILGILSWFFSVAESAVVSGKAKP